MEKCKICYKEFIRRGDLSRHVKKNHNINLKQYSVIYECGGKIPFCSCGCGNEVNFNQMGHFSNFLRGHMTEEMYKKRSEKTKKTLVEKCNVSNVSQLENIKQKKKETCLKNFGVENIFQLDFCKKNIKNFWNNFGVDNPSQLESIKQKKKETCLKNFGVDNPSKKEEIQLKKIKTSLEKYGVEYPMQNEGIFSKSRKNIISNCGTILHWKTRKRIILESIL